jgi:putative transposase
VAAPVGGEGPAQKCRLNFLSVKAAKPFFRKLLKGLPYVPRVIIPEKLTSDGAATRESLPGVEHGQSRSLNNRCEHSPCFTRQRAYRM